VLFSVFQNEVAAMSAAHLICLISLISKSSGLQAAATANKGYENGGLSTCAAVNHETILILVKLPP
jgi:hypothetical protein